MDDVQTLQVNEEAETESYATAESFNIQIEREIFQPWKVSRKVCIHRVLKCMRIHKPVAYDPLVISFGPYHYRKDPELNIMGQYKIEAVDRMCTRAMTNVTRLTEKIKELEGKIRERYGRPIELDGEKLSLMFTKDVCFILEYFRCASITRRESDCILGPFSQNTHNPVFQNKDIQNSTLFNIQVDILKLENQIPLFALITLLELEVSEHATSGLGALLQPDELESRTRKDVTAELAALLSTTAVFRGFPFSPL
ncbi:hypothetical protein SUGI_0699770 [Cryptomeria japonica]|nr:hypothetical protein SUGI_0699770 [Cryptomeria japonica]